MFCLIALVFFFPCGRAVESDSKEKNSENLLNNLCPFQEGKDLPRSAVNGYEASILEYKSVPLFYTSKSTLEANTLIIFLALTTEVRKYHLIYIYIP